eukprot:CAMPEP_0169396364 /NCGR_PEP_ID=MMETSP1017-20121227/51301_1 /TAXON_ID=342587 /ORGANISM="Karlodinium micrum, Strain CCMP2283" /LENGTH=40 /DNA_ID= /DNA_START= /DNA_END= /DNA_ORIENTATION=
MTLERLTGASSNLFHKRTMDEGTNLASEDPAHITGTITHG